MGDGIKAMWDDYNDYARLCKKYRVKMRGRSHPYESDYKHHAELVARERGTPGRRRRNWCSTASGEVTK